jgi:SOS-response transcriptional repressor LexA
MVIALVGGQDVTLKSSIATTARSACSRPTRRMQPMLFDPDNVQVQGVVIGVMRRY